MIACRQATCEDTLETVISLVFWGSSAIVAAALIVWLIGFLMYKWDPTSADMERWGFRLLGVAVGLAILTGYYLKQKGVPFVEDSNKCSCACTTTTCPVPAQK